MPGKHKEASTGAPLPAAAAAAPKVIAIGLSAGGLAPLLAIFQELQCVNAAVLVCQHLQPDHKTYTPELLRRTTRMPVKQAEDGDLLEPGKVYIGPPDFHLLLEAGKLRLEQSARLRFQRPSIDLTFASLAREYGAHAVAVVLSGGLKDGAAGLRAVHDAGGVTVVEAPADADFPSMPEAAIATGCADHIVPIAEMGAFLRRLCTGADTAA